MVKESEERKRIPALVVEGLPFPFYFDEEKIRQTIFFQAKADDIFIVSQLSLLLWTEIDCDLGHLPQMWDNMDAIHRMVDSKRGQAPAAVHG